MSEKLTRAKLRKLIRGAQVVCEEGEFSEPAAIHPVLARALATVDSMQLQEVLLQAAGEE